ncbi:putative reverse transcriptase domain-containing protein [Tanacetum coccineum]
MSSPNKPLPKPSRVAKMSRYDPIWGRSLTMVTLSNEVDVNLTAPMPKQNLPFYESIISKHSYYSFFLYSNNGSLQSHFITLSDSYDIRNGSLKKSGEKRGDGGEPSKEGNFKGDNKRARTRKVFATITNPVKKEYTGSAPKFTNYTFHHYPETPCRMCTNCNRLGYFAKDCRAGPKMVTPLNARNSTAARGACYECGGTDHYKSAYLRLNQALGQGGNRPNQSFDYLGRSRS